MCGIAGTVGCIAEARSITARMLTMLTHRGPDQEGIWEAGTVTFGHRRLSILDLSEDGNQPMRDPISGVVIVFNGECYNFKELRTELEHLGWQFRSSGDTEVVLAAYVAWGDIAFSRLRGMFALAVWDPRTEIVTLVRDRVGIKPLYYCIINSGLLFASEVRPLLHSGQIARKIDRSSLASYLWHGFVPGPRTIAKEVKLLSPGSIARFDRHGSLIEIKEFWSLARLPTQYGQQSSNLNVVETLEEAISIRMVSDVPLGVFLSGGVDSSVVAALAQRNSNSPISTFNLKFDEPKFDESYFAREVARQIGTDHHEITLRENDFADQLDMAIHAIDQPTFDALNTYFVSAAVKGEGITVALSGAGGDELFGGYNSFIKIPMAQKISRLLRFIPADLADRVRDTLATSNSPVPPQTKWGKFSDILRTKGDLISLYQVSYALFTSSFLEGLLDTKPDATLSFGLDDERRQLLTEMTQGESSMLNSISRLELSSFVSERLLRDTDSASMATSLEVRVPLLDHLFIESLQRLSDSERFRPLGKKQLLKSVLGKQVDPLLFERPKAGFELPLGEWTKSRLVGQISDTFTNSDLVRSIGLNPYRLLELWSAYRSGAPGIYWTRIWSIFILLSWCERHSIDV